MWVEKPPLEAGTWSGPHEALLATRILLEPGRNEKELAVRLFLGKLELTFIVPLDEAVPEMAKILSIVGDKPVSVH